MSETTANKMDLNETVAQNTGILARKVPPWAAGGGLVLGTVFAGLWFLRDPIIAIAQNGDRIEKLEETVKHCAEMRVVMEKEITTLKNTNEELRLRVSVLEKTTHNP